MRIKSGHFKKEYDLHKAELIGQGNFAQVYRIFDNDLHDSIAIRKVKKSQADLDDINKEKHINQELKKVENENILKIYDIIDQPEVVWYITEYCSGGSLWDALNLCKDNKMGEKQALECILQISKGVQELHNHRITHRDLKPENILLKSKYIVGKPLPVIKLADFGLSTQKIIMETIAGTKEYIAPEQAKFHNYTNAVDVWSLGIIFDEILHGTPFYSGEDNKEVFNKILKMPFKIRDENIRSSIKDLLLSLLKKKPYERPIIAVIRSTVQKILEQIENELMQKHSESLSERNKKRKSSNQIKGEFSKNSSEAKLNSVNSSSKDNISSIQSRKVYESGPLNRAEEEKMEKTWRSNIAEDSTPTNRRKANLPKEELATTQKSQPIVPKVQLKPPENNKTLNLNSKDRLEKAGRNKSIVDELFEPNKKQDSKNDKSKQETPLKSSLIPPIHDKISVYKSDRKKMIASNVKKQELKNQVVDINVYKTKIFNDKKALLEKSIKTERITAFLPNTQLVPSQFQQIQGSSEEALTNFKKKLNYLNYFSTSQDYEIRLARGSNELTAYKERCSQQLKQLQQSLKRIFLQQIDSYVDQYLDKVLK